MKRKDLITHLEKHGCTFRRKRGAIYINSKTLKASTIPRYKEINDYLRRICKDLGMPYPD